MSSVDLLDRIDDVTTPVCAQCDGPLGASPSDDFCGPDCQQAWVAHQHDVRELVGYIDPWDRPYEFPGVGGEAARWRDPHGSGAVSIPDWSAARLVIDTSHFRRMIENVQAMMQEMARAWENAMLGVSFGRPTLFPRVHDSFDFPGARAAYRERARECAEPVPDRLDLSWLDHYVPALDDPIDQVQAARRLFPERPVQIPHGALAGPAVHADARLNRRR